ncbi:MAG: hypothetical protein IJY39_00600 [Clostridia bacterium]|nr:hypothetical protein [Clostridia bacterium]
MNKRIILFCFLLILTSLAACNTVEIDRKDKTDGYVSVGKPFDDLYGNRSAKNPWDMIVFDEKLFVGSGNYDLNVGSCKIACLDLSSQAWSTCTVPDEEINFFAVINGNLIAPGIDPTEDWNLGNYYTYNGTDWVTVRNIPNGIHNFTIIEYNDTIFSGLGTTKGSFPVAASYDGGQSFAEVPFYKNGMPCTVTDSAKDRIYDLFMLGNRLFAVKTNRDCEIFLYNEEHFEYYDRWLYKIAFPKADLLQDLQKRGGFLSSVTHRDIYYFTTGYLFKTVDGKNVEHIPFSNSQYIIDLYCDNHHLYALGVSETKAGNYLSSVYSIDNGAPCLLFSISERAFPISFAVYGSDFYFGFGYTTYDPVVSGTIMKYTYKGEQK